MVKKIKLKKKGAGTATKIAHKTTNADDDDATTSSTAKEVAKSSKKKVKAKNGTGKKIDVLEKTVALPTNTQDEPSPSSNDTKPAASLRKKKPKKKKAVDSEKKECSTDNKIDAKGVKRKRKTLNKDITTKDGTPKEEDDADMGCESEEPPAKTKASHRFKVYIGNLPWTAKLEDVRARFDECGKVVSFTLLKDDKGRNNGIAFCLFEDSESVEKALAYDQTDFGGRNITVQQAKEGAE